MTIGLLQFSNNFWSALDGSLNAVSGSAQYPSLLTGYTTRPPWKVSGIDYAAGYTSGLSLTDISVSQPSGCVFTTGTSTGTLTVTSDNVIINGYDFSLYNSGAGVVVSCTSSNLTITNCKFDGSGYQAKLNNGNGVIDFRGQNLTLTYNKISGGNSLTGTNNGYGLVWTTDTGSGFGTFTAKYNWLTNALGGIHFHVSGNGSLDYRYNLIDDTDFQGGGHVNTLEIAGSGTISSCNVSYNSRRQVSNFPGELWQFYPASGTGSFTLVNPNCSNNTISAILANGAVVVGNPSASQGTGTVSGAGTSNQNYCDLSKMSGGTSFYYPSVSFVGWSFSGNIDLSTGNNISPP